MSTRVPGSMKRKRYEQILFSVSMPVELRKRLEDTFDNDIFNTKIVTAIALGVEVARKKKLKNIDLDVLLKEFEK